MSYVWISHPNLCRCHRLDTELLQAFSFRLVCCHCHCAGLLRAPVSTFIRNLLLLQNSTLLFKEVEVGELLTSLEVEGGIVYWGIWEIKVSYTAEGNLNRFFGWRDEKFTQTRPSWSIPLSVGSVKRMTKLQKWKRHIFTLLVLRILSANLEMNQNEMNQNKITHASRVSRLLPLCRACRWASENKNIDINKQHITIAAEAAIEERFQSERARSLFYRNFLRMNPKLETLFSKVVKSSK